MKTYRIPMPRRRSLAAALAGLAALAAACGDSTTESPGQGQDAGRSDGATPEPEPGVPIAGPELSGNNAEYDWHGYSLSPAGDVNGDGNADLLVSALAAGQGGRVSLYFGPITESKPATAANAQFVGEYGFSNLGESLAKSGGCDVNGDDLADVFVGAPFADVLEVAPSPATSGDNRGKAYLFFGKDKLSGVINAADADVTFLGEDIYDAAGSTTTCLGDLDGDGYGDIAISARRNSRGATRAGSVYIVYGRADLAASIPLAEADAVLVGEAAFDAAGVAVAAAGDVNGDGNGDILIGAPLADAGGVDTGAAYLVLGRGERLSGQISLASAVRFVGSEPGLRLGWSLDRAGDVDGDGKADLLLGSHPLPGESESLGGAWLVRGSELSGELTGDIDLAAAAVHLMGEATDDAAGVSVAGVGDMSGDGIDDILIGAPLTADGGRAYLVHGRQTWDASLALGAIGQGQGQGQGWTVGGTAADTYLGEVVAGLGDIDGDSISDLAIAARGTQVEAIHAGVVRIYRGQE